jgi:aminopeptidase-like protein
MPLPVPTRPDRAQVGEEMMDWLRRWYPIPRSLTGNGVRRTLSEIGQLIPLQVTEVPTGTPALDWEVPEEWNLREAWIAGPDGRRVVDVAEHSLHLVGYSVPIRRRMSLAELRPHLHSLPDRPDWIPYRTTYYRRDWGFCLTHRQLSALPEGEYDVCVDTTLEPGSLTYGECVLPGREPQEVLISSHLCHPSLANDNLSANAVAVALARHLLARPDRRYTYRFLFAPGTLGALVWLSRNTGRLDRLAHGLVLAGLGDPAPFTYKASRRGDAFIDRTLRHLLRTTAPDARAVDFHPFGYDERQYNSPGFDLPVGGLGRAPFASYPEYHTSGDNLDFVSPDRLAESLTLLLRAVDVLEAECQPRNLSPCGEPRLGPRGLYGRQAPPGSPQAWTEAGILWTLNLAEGRHGLLGIAERSGLPHHEVLAAAAALAEAGLLALHPSDDAHA